MGSEQLELRREGAGGRLEADETLAEELEYDEWNARAIMECHEKKEKAMRDLAVCFDGTRNREKTGTNVYRLYKFLCKDEGQEAVYFPGVGTKTGEWARGLLFGWGLSRQIKSAYGWLAERWREGDRIWVFGFSRGAYAARSLAGMIWMMGISKACSI